MNIYERIREQILLRDELKARIDLEIGLNKPSEYIEQLKKELSIYNNYIATIDNILKDSNDIEKEIYRLRAIHNLKPKHIAIRVNYSTKQVIRYLNAIEEILKGGIIMENSEEKREEYMREILEATNDNSDLKKEIETMDTKMLELVSYMYKSIKTGKTTKEFWKTVLDNADYKSISA